MIDDDEKLVSLMREYLESHGFEVAAAHDGNLGVEAALSTAPDLVILDLMLPGMDGLEVCRRVRQSSRVPILMLTARGDETDRIVGLEMGADDYLPKPFNARELLARIRAILRRSDGEEGAEESQRSCRPGRLVDIGSRMVTLRGQQVDLTTAEFDILHALASSAGRVLSRDQLCRECTARAGRPTTAPSTSTSAVSDRRSRTIRSGRRCSRPCAGSATSSSERNRREVLAAGGQDRGGVPAGHVDFRGPDAASVRAWGDPFRRDDLSTKRTTLSWSRCSSSGSWPWS